jgi:alcohol dehydrogenase (cytochrome c)
VWRFRFDIPPRESGVATATPIVAGGTVYVQDMESNVFALRLEGGSLIWERRFNAGNPGPNGLAADERRVYGSTDTTVFALSRTTGRVLWRRRILTAVEQFIDVAPVVANGVVRTATVGYPPGGRGALYALDAATGAVRWKFSTIRKPWRHPSEAGGGGAWYPPTLDESQTLYSGVANPAPWGGSRSRPNGGAFPGPALYTDSLVALSDKTGRLQWYDQVTPHDIRDHDFQLSPIVADMLIGGTRRKLVIGAGKSGRVIAWDRETHRRVWQASVGLHRNDTGPLPRRMVSVCPGLYGGVETPMAYANGRLFVPVVNLCARGSAVGYDPIEKLDVARGRGALVALAAATGRRLWTRRLAQPTFGCATVARDVVFTSTWNGRIYGFRVSDGKRLWSAQMRAGINACPAIAGDMLLVPGGVPRAPAPTTLELVAYRTNG